jgi:hypothetical protein
MTKPETFQEQMDVLAYGEVHPLLFATDIERRERPTSHREAGRSAIQVAQSHAGVLSPPDSLLDGLSLKRVAHDFTDAGDRACHRDRLAGAETSHLV